MNARQKAKYWKRKYLELAGKHQELADRMVVSECKIKTLSYTKVIDDEVRIRQISDNLEIRKFILGNVVNELADQAKNFVDIFVEEDPFTCQTRINGRLLVVVPSAYVRRRMEEIL